MKSLLFAIFVIFIWIGGIIGWAINVYKFASSDFQESYKSEIVRGVGIPFAPLGSIIGYINIGDED